MNDRKYTLRLKVFNGFMLFIVDSILILLSCFIAYYLRFYTEIFSMVLFSGTINSNYVLYSLIITVSSIILFAIFGLYDINRAYRNLYYYLKIPAIILVVVLITYFSARIIDGFYFSRLWIGFVCVIGIITVSIGRFLYGKLIKLFFRRAGIPYEGLIIDFLDYIRAFNENSRVKKKVIYGIVLVANDIFFLGAAFYLSYYIRFNIDAFEEDQVIYFIEKNYLFYSVIFIISAILIFSIFRLYNWDNIYRGSGYYSRIVKGIIINIIVIILAGYIFDLFTFSRKWILLLFIFSMLFIYASRIIIDFVGFRLIKKAGASPATIIVGIGENSKRIEDSFSKYSLEDDEILGYVDNKQRIDADKDYSKYFNILGGLNDLKKIIYKYKVQRVIISGPEYKYFEILDILEKLKGIDISVLVFPGFFEFSVKRMNMREIAGIPLMQVTNIGFFGINLFIKNVIDYVLGSILFIFFI